MLNQFEFDALTANGSVEELKRELALLREARKVLGREDNRLVSRQTLVVEALADRQEAELK